MESLGIVMGESLWRYDNIMSERITPPLMLMTPPGGW